MPRPASSPIERFENGGPHRQADPDRLAEAFRRSVTRKVTRTATVPPEGNACPVDPARWRWVVRSQTRTVPSPPQVTA
jgi:hypothetical protein